MRLRRFSGEGHMDPVVILKAKEWHDDMSLLGR